MKSPPELWAQCSDPLLLSKHLGDFGDITITRLEPESTVAWEGESVSGTVSLEVSGWGTRVRLTATESAVGAAEAQTTEFTVQEVEEDPPVRLLLSEPRGLGALIGAIRRRRRTEAVNPTVRIPADRVPTPTPTPTPTVTPSSASAAGELSPRLEAALDSLGQAHHRPYSRS